MTKAYVSLSDLSRQINRYIDKKSGYEENGSEVSLKPFLENRKYRDGFPVGVHQTRDRKFRSHWHIEVELCYVLEGSLAVGINSERVVLGAGDFALASSYDVHYYDNQGLGSTSILLIFRPELVGCPLGWPEGCRFDQPLYQEGGETSERVKTYLVELLGEYTQRPPFYQTQIRGLLTSLSSVLLRALPHRSLSGETGQRGVPTNRTLLESLSYMEQNATHPLTLTQVADHAGLSPHYFSQQFGKLTGMNFRTFLNSLRLERAEELVREGNATLSEIALDCGFESVRTFNRAYREIHGGKPTDLRRASRTT